MVFFAVWIGVFFAKKGEGGGEGERDIKGSLATMRVGFCAQLQSEKGKNQETFFQWIFLGGERWNEDWGNSCWSVCTVCRREGSD